MNSKSFSRSNFPEMHLYNTSISLIVHITEVVCIEGFFEAAMIEYARLVVLAYWARGLLVWLTA